MTTRQEDNFAQTEVVRALRNHATMHEGVAANITPTSMHYLLCHFDVPQIDAGTFKLSVGGRVARPLQLSLDDIRRMPAERHAVTLECAGNGRMNFDPRPKTHPWNEGAVGTAEWTGTPLAPILEKAGVMPAAQEVLFTGSDRGIEVDDEIAYQRSLPIDEARRPGALLAYEMNGAPLPPPFGYPLRLVVPHWYGMASVKWLASIEVLDREFHGHYMDVAYRNKASATDPGAAITHQKVRSVMVPPGVRYRDGSERRLKSGATVLTGKAWAGRQAIARVEVSVDGGARWLDATLGAACGRYAWTPWSFAWQAKSGHYPIMSRATAADGTTQPSRATWNYLGMENNAVQTIAVTVI